MNNSQRLIKLSYREKSGYAFGDFGFNLYWASLSSFLAVFYTDVFGITAAAAATMFFLTKLLDAITDPLMGAIADRTSSRWGKFRPYLLFAGIPMAGAAVITFSTPALSDSGKLIYAYVTYSLMMLFYTILSTPYSSLSGVLTAEPQERNQLVSFRFIAAFIGTALVNQFTLPLVELLGDGNEARGWQLTMGIYGILATIAFWITFATTKERIAPPPAQKTSPFADLVDLSRNRPWVILIVLALIIMMTITLRAGSSYYYLKYYIDRADLISSYLAIQAVALGIGAALTPLLTRFIDKKNLLAVLMVIVGALSIGFYFVPKENIALIFAFNILISLALGPKSPLAWSMYADAADYNEWKTGRRATAMTFSAATFAQKLGGALGSALMLWILAGIGYVAKEAQSNASQQGIAMLQTILPGVIAIVAAIVILFYPLDNKKLDVIQKDLSVR